MSSVAVYFACIFRFTNAERWSDQITDGSRIAECPAAHSHSQPLDLASMERQAALMVAEEVRQQADRQRCKAEKENTGTPVKKARIA